MPIYYEVPQEGEVQVRIYSLVGWPIRHLVDAPLSAGAGTAYWNGKDDTGALVASGLYLVVLTEPGAKEIRKVLALEK